MCRARARASVHDPAQEMTKDPFGMVSLHRLLLQLHYFFHKPYQMTSLHMTLGENCVSIFYWTGEAKK